ncbi:hypothetical protein OQ968_24730, partial [Mycobacterium sp. 663a-19]|nr:hypothetical protein [Mycobacterium sp. 663a-19]
PPKPKRNPWPLIAAAIAAVVILTAGAVGIAMVMGGDDNKPQAQSTTKPTPTTSSSRPTTTTTPAGDAQSKLRSLLPAGYAGGTCTPATPKPNSIWVKAVAMVDCGQNTNPGGPARAVYGLFANVGALKKAFDDDIAAVQLTNCPGGGPSPDSWHYEKSPTVTAGMVACGTYKDQPNVIWTNESKLMLSDVFGDPPAMEDLHGWWEKYG